MQRKTFNKNKYQIYIDEDNYYLYGIPLNYTFDKEFYDIRITDKNIIIIRKNSELDY